MKNNLLELFYNYVVNEAAGGRVDCFFKYNMIFNTKIVEENRDITFKNDNPNLLIPTLVIRNHREFDSLLLEYVQRSLEFYSNDNYEEEVFNSLFWDPDNEYGVSKEKLIMTLLWSNATMEDFNHPCQYLRKRLSFFELGEMRKYLEPTIIRYSKVLDANVEIHMVANRLENETPYSMQIFLRDTIKDRRIYEFPTVYMGISDNDGYIYAIQNKKDRFIDEDYFKKIERKLYKVNEGFDNKEDTFDNYGIGNLKDITPSFLIAANIAIGIFRENGIQRVYVPSILVSRWNAKMLTLDYKKESLKKKNISLEETNSVIHDYYDKYIMIQSNLTEKFLRIFRRLGYHHSSIGIYNYPMDMSSELIMNLFDGQDICNNSLLNDTYSVGKLGYRKGNR